MTWLRRIPAAAWTAALAALATLWLFYPGFASFDTAHQWYQVRHGEFSDHHPPLMAFVWLLTEPFLPGPGGPFVLQVLVYWLSLAIIAAHLFARAPAQIAAVVLVGFAPPLFGLLLHVWKDVTLMTWLLAAAALLVVERGNARPVRWLLAVASLLLVGVGALRHNGLAAVLPLAIYIAWRGLGSGRQPVRWPKTLAAALVLFTAITVLSQLPARHPSVERMQFWPTVALWDLAAVSIAEDRMLIPSSLQLRPLTPSDLAEHFRPSVNVPLLAQTDFLKISLITPYSDKELAELRSAWLSLPFTHTGSYCQHRWRLWRAQIGLPGEQMPPPQDLMPDHASYRDNPPLQPSQRRFSAEALSLLTKASGTVWLAGWPWLLASVAIAWWLWRRRRATPLAPLGIALVTSAWAYCLPLIVLSASSELRYLSASLTAIAVAGLIALASARVTGPVLAGTAVDRYPATGT